MKKYIACVGTYTNRDSEGIYTYEYDSTEGILKKAIAPVKIENPSYMAVSKDNKYLYTVLESDSFKGEKGGGVGAFSIDRDNGSLTFLNAQPTTGRAPCYLSVDNSNEYLVAANYHEGTVTLFPIMGDGRIAPLSFKAIHEGHGPNKERQEKAHAHFAEFFSDKNHVYTVDLGIDQVKVYSLDRCKGALVPEDRLSVKIKPGSGPRHMAFHSSGSFAYVVTELSSEIAALKYSREDSRYDILQYISALPEGYEGTSYASAIHISPDGRFLYASNRGHDSVVVFKIDGTTGMLEPVSHYAVNGKWPRDFTIDPEGNFLFSANQNSDTITSFRIDHKTGGLEPAGQVINVPSPVCIKFIALGE